MWFCGGTVVLSRVLLELEMQKFAGFKEAMLAVKAEMTVAEVQRLKERTIEEWLSEGGES